MTEIDRLLSRANPVPTPPPGRVTPAQERLLASIVADRPRRRRVHVVRLIAVPAAIAVAVALALVTGRGAGVNDEIEATEAGLPAPGNGELIHVSTRLYGTLYGPGLGERLDGWFEPATGRARIVITTGGEMTLQQVVDAEGRMRSWQGALGNAGGITGEHTAPGAAASVRRLVRNRMSSLVAQAKRGFRRDNATVGSATTRPGEYRGRPVTVHRIAPSLSGGRPSGYYFKWYTETDTGAIIAFERGAVAADGDEVVEEGEELTKLESVPAAQAPRRELMWQEPPATQGPVLAAPTIIPSRPTPPGATPTPWSGSSRPTPTPTPTPRARRPRPAPTPTPRSKDPRPTATPTPKPSER